jgi:hypothetical protein
MGQVDRLDAKGGGTGVRLWTGQADEQAAAREEGLDARNARLGVDLATREAELDDVTDALLLTGSDNFNALAAFELRQELGHDHVYRLAAGSDLLDLVPKYAEGRTLFRGELTFAELARCFDAGAKLVTMPGDDRDPANGDGMTLLFVVSSTGRLRVVTRSSEAKPATGDTAIWLAGPPGRPGPTDSPASR